MARSIAVLPLWCLTASQLFPAVLAASLSVYIHYPETSLNPNWIAGTQDCCMAQTLGAECSCFWFGVNYQACQTQLHTDQCPGGLATFDDALRVNETDKVRPNIWRKVLDVGPVYQGPVTVDLYAPQVYGVEGSALLVRSSVVDCYNSKANIEMGPELCEQTGNPWTVNMTAGESQDVHIYPAFGMHDGETRVLLPHFFSPQLNNSRNVSTYIPSSILNNGLRRSVDILILLDGSAATVESFATRGGFAAAQAGGVAPESIMIGITALEFAYAFDFDQRTYELTYDYWDSDDGSCVYSPHTGGSSKLLEWLDEDVVPAVLAKLGTAGMDRGEITIAGGSLGGLTSCYAAASRPDVFQRAICMSPTNCFRYSVGGLVPTIQNLSHNDMLPKAVLQFIGVEALGDTYDALSTHNTVFEGQTQLNFLSNEDTAWRSVGMRPANFTNSDFFGANLSWAQNTFPWSTIGPVPDNMVMSFVLPGVGHSPWSWQQEFNFALNLVYRPNRSETLRIPIEERVRYMFLDEGSTPYHSAAVSDDDGNKSDQKLRARAKTLTYIVAVCAFLLFVAVVSFAILLLWPQLFGLQSTKHKSATFSSETEFSATRSPMSMPTGSGSGPGRYST